MVPLEGGKVEVVSGHNRPRGHKNVSNMMMEEFLSVQR
jgi:hypothetical protein